jgi:hypothetical protein
MPKQAFLTTFATLALLILVTTSINFSWVQSFHNSDSLLAPLMSIDHYTPFYWGQNRCGQLFPLMVSFIRNYTVNLFAQTELLVGSSLGCMVLFNLYFLHQNLAAPQRQAAALLAVVLSVCLLAPTVGTALMLAMGSQPYMPSLFLVLLAVALFFRIRKVRMSLRIAGTLLLLLIAFWINMSAAPLAAGLILCTDVIRPQRQLKLRLAALLALAAAFGANVWLAHQYPGSGHEVLDPWHEWLVGVQTFSARAVPYFFHQVRLLSFVMLLLILILVQFARGRISQNYRVDDALVFVAAAIAFAVMVGGVEWVKLNGYSPRYCTISVMLLLFVATGWVSAAIVRLLSNRMGAQAALLVSGFVLASLIVGIFGFPSYTAAKSYLSNGLDRIHFDADQDARTLGCTHFVGNYWIGWILVFQRESHGGPPIYAITARSQDTRDLWNWDPSRARTYCGIPGDAERETWRSVFGLPPLRESTRYGGLCRLEVAAGS